MSRLRSFTAAAAAVACLATRSPAGIAGPAQPDSGIVRLEASSPRLTVRGTATLVRRDTSDTGTVLYFLTAAHLVKQNVDGERAPGPMRITLTAPDGTTVATSGTIVTVPDADETGMDIAVLRVVASVDLTPMPLSLVAPAIGDAFAIRGPDPVAPPIAQRVLFRSARFVVGDRPVEATDGLVGAPVIDEAGMFGVVTSFGSNGVPMIALLSSTPEMLTREVPKPAPPAPLPLRLEQRSVDGPLLTVACGATASGDLDVPVPLAARESLVGAKAQLREANTLSLGEITVLSLSDRSVKLRFTMIGTPPPAFAPPTTCPGGRALVTVGVDVLVVAK